LLYDHTGTNSIAKIIIVNDRKVHKTDDDRYLLLKLKNGLSYDEAAVKDTYFNPRQELDRMRFRETAQQFDFARFNVNRIDEDSFRSNTQMLNLKGLTRKEDSLSKAVDSLDRLATLSVGSYYKQNNFTKGYTKIKMPVKVIKGDILKTMGKEQHLNILQGAT